MNITIHYCVPDDQEAHLPVRRRAPHYVPAVVPLPNVGDVIYLSSSSAWGVRMRIYEWLSPEDLKIEIWIDYVGSSRYARPTGFSLTQ